VVPEKKITTTGFCNILQVASNKRNSDMSEI
jgi:hypothetical protein